MHVVPASVWLPVLERVYAALDREYPVVVIGSQVLCLHAGLCVPSKDIDLLIPQYNPLRVEEIVAEAMGLEEGRLEVLRRRDNIITHVYVPVGRQVVSVEIFTRTHLGPLTDEPLGSEVVLVERGGRVYRAVSLEAYLVLQATRPEGPRPVDQERLTRIAGRVNWRKVEHIVSRLPAAQAERVHLFASRLRGGGEKAWRGGNLDGTTSL